jgi:hypothetical protein
VEQPVPRLRVVVRSIGGADDRQGRFKRYWVANPAGVVADGKLLIVNPEVQELNAVKKAAVVFCPLLYARDNPGTQGTFNRGFYEDTSSDVYRLGHP